MAFDRRSMVTFRPSSSTRTFSSRVPNRVSMLGLIPMLFFIQSLRRTVRRTMWGQPPRLSRQAKRGALTTDLSQNTHASATAQTKQDYAWRRDQPECSCPEGKSLPLGKAYPARGWESMATQSFDQPRLSPVE